MRKIAAIMLTVAFLAILIMPHSAVIGAEASVSVLIDYGDGRYVWLESNGTGNAFNITLAACESAGIEVNYSVSAYGVMVNAIGGMSGGWPGPWWHFWLWNSTSASWELSSSGADSVTVEKGAIAWSLVAGYPGDSPAATPENMHPWPSYRNGPGAPGYSSVAGVEGPVNRTEIPMNCGFIDSSVIYADGKIIGVTSGIYNWTSYSYDSEPQVFCMDTDHEIIWKSDIGGAGWQVSTPLYADGMVIVGSTDGKLYALDINTGNEDWNYTTGQSFTGITSSPMYYGGSIYVGSGDGFLYSIALNGSLNWKFNTSASIYAATPTTDGLNIFVGNDDGELYAVNTSGGEVWNATLSGKIRGGAVVAGDEIIVTSTVYSGYMAVSGNITALSGTDGSILWSVKTGPATPSPAYDGKRIYAAAGSVVMSLDMDGKVIWEKDMGGPLKASPTIAGDVIYAVTSEDNSTLYALNTSNGDELWNDTVTGGSYVLSSPVPVENTLVMGADTGSLYIYTHKVMPSGGANDSVPDSSTGNDTDEPLTGLNMDIYIYMAVGIVMLIAVAGALAYLYIRRR